MSLAMYWGDDRQFSCSVTQRNPTTGVVSNVVLDGCTLWFTVRATADATGAPLFELTTPTSVTLVAGSNVATAHVTTAISSALPDVDQVLSYTWKLKDATGAYSTIERGSLMVYASGSRST